MNPPSEPLGLNALLDDEDRGIVVCCGSGGVGKTTTAAALALRAAERGRRVVVLTIDPARRLAQALGLESLDNTPRRVAGTRGSGSLDAMMLDMKRTFDEIVLTHAAPSQAEQILANPFYQALSSSFAGTQEYMAMERLGQLYTQTVAGTSTTGSAGQDEAEPLYDLIVVDTPPSRSALDFLDAPNRLSSFLDSRLLRLLTTPARGPLKMFSAGVAGASGILAKVLGAEVLNDVRTFVGSLDSTFGGFRERAERTYALLQQPSTAFLVVAAPETDALREASYFVDRLRDESMPLAGLVLNRRVTVPADGLSAERSLTVAETLAERLDPDNLDPESFGPDDLGSGSGQPAHARGHDRSPCDTSPPDDDLTEKSHDDQSGRRRAPDGPDETTADLRATVALLRLHADRVRLAERQRRLTERFAAAHPGVPTVELPSLATDVHDLEALRDVLAETD